MSSPPRHMRREGYTTTLLKYGIAAIPYPWDTYEDQEAMFAALRAGRIRALVLDAPLIHITDATTCDLMEVGDR